MSWIPLTVEGDIVQEAEIHRMMGEVKPHFSADERAYLTQAVNQIHYLPLAAPLGRYIPSLKRIDVSSEPGLSGLPLLNYSAPGAGKSMPMRIKHTLAHELSHPLYLLAAKDNAGGFLIINPDRRKAAQDKARDMFPEAIAWVEKAMEGDALRQRHPRGFSRQEIVAMQTYLMLDERFYDVFGDANTARVTRQGYTRPNRNHEIACNLRGLQICEPDMLGGPSAGIVDAIAGDILSHA